MPGGKTVEVDVSKQTKRIAMLSVALVVGVGLAGLGAESTDQPAGEIPASEAQELLGPVR